MNTITRIDGNTNLGPILRACYAREMQVTLAWCAFWLLQMQLESTAWPRTKQLGLRSDSLQIPITTIFMWWIILTKVMYKAGEMAEQMGVVDWGGERDRQEGGSEPGSG